jgi:Fe-S cluster assembly protein SufD
MAIAELKLAATQTRLTGMVMPEGLNDQRLAAMNRVITMGLAHKRDEYWKYTDPTSLTVSGPVHAPVFDNNEAPQFDAIDRIKIVFVDGVFDADASDDFACEGVEISRLCDLTDGWASELYGTLEERGQVPVHRTLATLNTAFASDGIVIRATAKASKPINLIYLHTDETSDVMLHNVVRVDAGAELTLLENGPAAARFNGVLEVDVAEGGAFHHVRSQGRDHERRAVTHCFARLATKSLFKSFTLTSNGVLTRNECVLDLIGDDVVAHVAGACVGDGADFNHDDTVFITHDGLRGESRQVFKKVLRNGATGVFQGKILVKAGAQKTDGYQISQSLLLDGDSQFLAKPELEIYADDVICSHGSTTGAIDEDAMFYLQSRGVPRKAATDLLTLAFLAESLEEISDDALADDLRNRLESWLARHS